MAVEVKVPTLGESVTEATIGEWLKQPGEPVKLGEPVASLETDKVAVEVPSPVAGTMGEQRVKEGDTVAVGAVIATIEDSQQAGETTEVKEREKPQPAAEQPPAPAPAPPPAEEDDHTTTLSPAVRRAVLEHGVDPSAIKGTGKDGRLTKEDVLAAAQAKKAAPAPAVSAPAPSPTPESAPAPAGERREERVKMTRLRQTIA
jgi:2-oxoglutarate dehydrogenase E2 component (dihydrolipoamide succinyltransferase)